MNGLERKGTWVKRFTAGMVLTFALSLPAFASEHVISHFWEADSQTRAGAVVTCYIQLTAVNYKQIAITMNVSIFAQMATPELVENMTMVKITASRITNPFTAESQPIKINYGWVKSSSGTSVGKVKITDVSPDPYFLGVAAGMDLFQEITFGILKDGVTVGYQEKPGTFDVTFTIATPPSGDVSLKLGSCLSEMRQRIMEGMKQ